VCPRDDPHLVRVLACASDATLRGCLPAQALSAPPAVSTLHVKCIHCVHDIVYMATYAYALTQHMSHASIKGYMYRSTHDNNGQSDAVLVQLIILGSFVI
jgi:hypothetical protein